MNDLRIAGYASVFGVPDSGGDVVLPGAFAGAARRGPSPLPLLWQHDVREPIGFVESFREDARGLRVVARVVASGRGGHAARLLEAGAIDGLSFGYRVKAAGPGAGLQRGVRELRQLELIEVSVVTFPMQPLARVLGVSMVAKGDDA
jgi:HK97 family phage prohead protease